MRTGKRGPTLGLILSIVALAAALLACSEPIPVADEYAHPLPGELPATGAHHHEYPCGLAPGLPVHLLRSLVYRLTG